MNRPAVDTSSILIIRTSALGDVIHALPVLNALNAALPESRIGWVVEDVFAPLIADHPALDQVIPVRLRGWRRSWTSPRTRAEIIHAWRSIRSFQATVALDLMGNHKGGFLARCSGARTRVGPASQDRREPLSHLWINRPQPLAGGHAIDRVRSLLLALDLATDLEELGPAHFEPAHCVPELTPEAAAFRQDHPRPYILIQPGAGWANKQYSAESWGLIAKKLADDGHEVMVLAGPGEEQLAETVVTNSSNRAHKVSGPGMGFLVGVLRGAKLLLGGDTGPLHLAHSLGVPVLAVMGPTDPSRHGPYGAPDRVIVHPLPCSFCSKRLPETQACLQIIPPERVLAATQRYLAKDKLAGTPIEIQ